MKRNITKLLLPLTLFSAIGCSDNIQSGDKDMETIQLYVAGSGLSAATKAAIVPFGTTIFASTQSGVYTSLSATDEWMKDAAVAEDGSVSFKDNSNPSYPETGGWIYLIAVAPAVQTSAGNTGNGTVTYTLGDTPQDLLYAKEIRGSRWDGQRFSGNTVHADDKPLAYEHLLTQLQFKARKVTAGGLDVTVTKITVQDVQTSVTLTLSDGTTTFSGQSPVSLALESNNTVSGSSTDAIDLGNILLPPPCRQGHTRSLSKPLSAPLPVWS
ncbi:MAG: fimbrillin family protein [Parabacteroides sp.]|nr:fimbrillin family protein [Parabacteroides sp.]